MPKTIVFFNLADMHGHGLAQKSVASLKQKYPAQSRIYEYFKGANRVCLVDMFGMLEEQLHPTPITSLSSLTAYIPRLKERLAIIQLCATADKLMLGVHGKYGDTENGYAGLGWEKGDGVMGTCTQFAKLISGFLIPEKQHKLSLIVCFGARAQNYRTDHDGNLEAADIKSSFAYKFYKEICDKVPITMTARTGSVSFDEQTGKSLVQTEAAVKAEVALAELQGAETTKRAAEEYEKLQQMMCTTQEGIEKFKEMAARMADSKNVPLSRDEQTIRDYDVIKAKVTTLTSASNMDATKYGKFVYTYDAGNITVMRKYEGGQKVFKVLYKGLP